MDRRWLGLALLCSFAVHGPAVAAQPAERPAESMSKPGLRAPGTMLQPVAGYMDRHEETLRARVQRTGVLVSRKGVDELFLSIPANIAFEGNSAAVRPTFYGVLSDLATVFKSFDQTNLVIVGHTDALGNDMYNQQLSEQRAVAVGDFMRSQGVAHGRLRAEGRGEAEPVADNNSAAGRIQNQRVDIHVKASRTVRSGRVTPM